MALSDADAVTLLALARDSVRHGLEHGRPLAAAPGLAGPLAEPGACFVSLHVGAELRGCIGRTEAASRLVDQLLDNAWAAAFRDPRFPALKREELERLSFEVHVLTPLQSLPFGELADLYARLRRGVDGLQLETETRRGVFLPVMWEQLPEPRDFVGQLLRKAGIREAEPFTAQRFGARMFRADRLAGLAPDEPS
ncbi:MAG: AmmeMemoRadiSam system protein A [Nevskiaceae bacterium]